MFYGVTMASAIRQLLDEISWEGNAVKYRGGGVGKENVLTAEVFQALDLLPRAHFFAPVLQGLHGIGTSAREGLAADAEAMRIEVLPGDLVTVGSQVRVQPDVLMESESWFVFVEAKAVNRASFQPNQLSRELLVSRGHSEGRQAVLMLVLGSDPPVAVRGHGRMSIDDAIELGGPELAGRGLDTESAGVHVCWTTWKTVADTVDLSLADFANPDPSVEAAVSRQVQALRSAIDVHSRH
jgi:hypothetical protein